MPTPGVANRIKAGRCSCDEAYVAVFSEDKYAIERLVPNNLNVHDCDYIRERNRRIPAAERLSKETGIPFLKAMDFLMSVPSAEEIIRANMAETEAKRLEAQVI